MRSIGAIIAAITLKVMQTSAYRCICKVQYAFASHGIGAYFCTFVNEKLTPTRKTGPQMGLNRVTGNTTGFTSGTTTGKTISKAGVATKTPMSASRRAEQNAFNKGGVAGPSRGGGGGSRSSGGMGKSSGGGGRGMTGGGGMGASGRGTGGKR